MITVNGLKKRNSLEFELGPLDFELHPGYITAMVGPNGSGKSTIFRLLMNYVRPNEGSLSFWGDTYADKEVGIKTRIGYVPEISELDTRGKHLDDIVPFLSHWYPTWDSERYQALKERFELRSDLKFSEMSKGMHRKCSLILAMSHHPELLLLDEPSSGLDPFANRVMMEEITSFMENPDRMVLMATHSMDEVRRLADYVLFMYHGKQLGFFEKDALVENWRSVWVERMPENPLTLPGVLQADGEAPTRLITNRLADTQEALESLGLDIRKTEWLELDEILLQLLLIHKKKAVAS